jgi:hypothetical protein
MCRYPILGSPSSFDVAHRSFYPSGEEKAHTLWGKGFAGGSKAHGDFFSALISGWSGVWVLDGDSGGCARLKSVSRLFPECFTGSTAVNGLSLAVTVDVEAQYEAQMAWKPRAVKPPFRKRRPRDSATDSLTTTFADSANHLSSSSSIEIT